MAIENYKPTLWEDSIMENFHDSSFVGIITTPPVEKKGEKVVFNRIAPGAWKQYTTGQKIEWSAVATTKVEMTFPNQKYYAFMIDDCDAVQTKNDVLNSVTKEQSGVLGEEVDQEVIGFIVNNISPENTIGAVGTEELVNKSNAYEFLVDLNTMANKNKVPLTDRYFIIPPDYLALLAKDERFTNEYTVLENGIVEGATINGTTLICKADNPLNQVILTHKSGTGYAMQLSGDAEAVRLQDYFGDGVRGIVKYGYTELRNESSYMAYVKFS
ncbi:hypothetical protein GCM10008908_39420 [Clostridium subterminale]|uniref:Uncharacterized protein n=1 Tax=Clostridium subterminale TaxID=1550 RepID=A0ABP3W8M2_CLOSU